MLKIANSLNAIKQDKLKILGSYRQKSVDLKINDIPLSWIEQTLDGGFAFHL